MSKADSNDKNNANKKQPEGRILRARDIIPGTSKSRSAPSSRPRGNSEKNSTSAKEHANAEHASNIPKFDLAEEILAEQRKITAIRRKAPYKSSCVLRAAYCEKEKTHDAIRNTQYEVGQKQIIKEIVARDIEKLCSAEKE